jgi:hypothetical protein
MLGKEAREIGETMYKNSQILSKTVLGFIRRFVRFEEHVVSVKR